jgi:hypothetical protein
MELIKPSQQQERLIELLINKADVNFPANWKDGLFIKPMEDGGMGSLYLFPKDSINKKRIFGKQVSEYQFSDTDGVQVIASLNVDQDGKLFELDIWKTDYSPLIQIPRNL